METEVPVPESDTVAPKQPAVGVAVKVQEPVGSPEIFAVAKLL